MRNLAGETKADLFILEELDKAGIEVVEGKRSRGEVPFTLTGKLGDWDFERAWYYWMARASDGKGLPLDVATELHYRGYSRKEGQPKTYGQVIRVAGDCGCPDPKEWAFPTDEILRPQLEKLGKKSVNYGELAELCNRGEITGPRFVNSYHIDSQEGLNALACTFRTMHKMTSSGTDPEKIKQLHDKISALYVQWETDQHQDGIEWLKKLPTIVYDNCTVTELIVAIKKEHEVVSIAKKWEDNQHRGGIVQHFFEAGQITGFNYGNVSGPGQVLNRGPEIDERLRPHYEELKTLRPHAADSLEQCMQELEKPGPEYTESSDGSISLKLKL